MKKDKSEVKSIWKCIKLNLHTTERKDEYVKEQMKRWRKRDEEVDSQIDEEW